MLGDGFACGVRRMLDVQYCKEIVESRWGILLIWV